MKTFYENPEMEITRFETEDVITTSGMEVEEGVKNTEPGWDFPQ